MVNLLQDATDPGARDRLQHPDRSIVDRILHLLNYADFMRVVETLDSK